MNKVPTLKEVRKAGFVSDKDSKALGKLGNRRKLAPVGVAKAAILAVRIKNSSKQFLKPPGGV